jgi:hypothetical protein
MSERPSIGAPGDGPVGGDLGRPGRDEPENEKEREEERAADTPSPSLDAQVSVG